MVEDMSWKKRGPSFQWARKADGELETMGSFLTRNLRFSDAGNRNATHDASVKQAEAPECMGNRQLMIGAKLSLNMPCASTCGHYHPHRTLPWPGQPAPCSCMQNQRDNFLVAGAEVGIQETRRRNNLC